MDLNQTIEKVTKETFEELARIYKKNLWGSKTKSRLVFTNYSSGKYEKRLSEQELRFVFIEKLIPELEQQDLFYSIETPTQGKYKFSEKGNKKLQPICDIKGQSASFDLVILNRKEEKLALIEFKAKNAHNHEHAKDFCKLMNPAEGENALRYFIEIIESYDQRTIKNLKGKIDNYQFPIMGGDEKPIPIRIACYCLEKYNESSLGEFIQFDPMQNQSVFYIKK